MHPAIGHKSHHMRDAAAALKLTDKRVKRCVLAKRAIFDCQINLTKIHRHHTPSADIHMTHF